MGLTTLEMIGIAEEFRFWKGFVRTPRFINGWVKGPNAELDAGVAQFILGHPHQKVLDVGSGAVSILHNLIPDECICAVDPLAGLYAEVFDYSAYGLRPPRICTGEELEDREEFAIAHIRNALDHTQQPDKVMTNLLRAVKGGGYVIAQGFDKEAQHENRRGFHQWDIELRDGHLYANDIDLGLANVWSRAHALPNGRIWHVWITRKEPA